jgi:DNA-binding NarL/FixJ family response regulator
MNTRKPSHLDPILLVGDESRARTRLASQLRASGRTCLIHANVESALQDRQLHHVNAVVADVVLHNGSARSDVRLISTLRAAAVRAPVVLVTASADANGLKAALNAGAAYLLERPFTAGALEQALEKVTAVDLDLARHVTQALVKARLTRKEELVARNVLRGLSSSEIALIAGCKVRTIKQYLTRIYAKLGVGSRAGFFHFVYPS